MKKKAGLSHFELPRIRFNHQWLEGRTKILFAGWGQYKGLLKNKMQTDLTDSGIYIDPNKTKSLGMMVPTPIIDNHKTFTDQLEKMLEGLAKAEFLRNYFVNNIEIFQNWAKIIKSETGK